MMKGLYCTSMLFLTLPLLLPGDVLGKDTRNSGISPNSANNPKDLSERPNDRRITEELVGEIIGPTVVETLQQKSSRFGITKFLVALDGKRGYNQINSFLVDSNPSDNTNINMAKAFDYMHSEMKKDSIMGVALVEALKQFTSLVATEGEQGCTKEGYAILARNDRATEGRARNINSKLNPPKRIDKLVNRFSFAHAQTCQKVYPKTFKRIYAKLDTTKITLVDSLFMQLFLGSPSTSEEAITEGPIEQHEEQLQQQQQQQHQRPSIIARLYDGFIKNTLNAESDDDVKLIYETLEETVRARGDPDVIFMHSIDDEKKAARVVRKDKMKELYRHYISDPCEYYVRQLGPDVFIPATFDAEWQHQVDYHQYEYYFGWAKYRLCVFLLDNERLMVRNMAKLGKETFPYQ